MGKLLTISGFIGLVVFFVSGNYMAAILQPLDEVGMDATRMMFRANHIYMLLASSACLLTGVYYRDFVPGWPQRLQVTGALFIALSAMLFIVAFWTESGEAAAERVLTLWGAILSFAGGTLSVLAGLVQRSHEKMAEYRAQKGL